MSSKGDTYSYELNSKCVLGGRPGNSTTMKKKARKLNNLLKLRLMNPIFEPFSCYCTVGCFLLELSVCVLNLWTTESYNFGDN